MAFAGEAPKLDRNEYPLELKKILRILEKHAGGRGHGSTDVWTVRCITALEAFYRKHIGDQIRKASTVHSEVEMLRGMIARKDQQIEAHAASYAELEKRVGDYPEACAALEKQLKFASDRLERADEEKKELQEVLRAWEAENLRLRTQVVKLMEQQVKSAALEAKAHQNDMIWQKDKAALVRQLKGNNKQNVQRRLHLTNSHKSLREEKRRWLDERQTTNTIIEESETELNQVRLQLQQLEGEHLSVIEMKESLTVETLQYREQVAELEAELSATKAQMIKDKRDAKDALARERDEWRLKVEGIPMAKERKEELLVNNRNLRAERDDIREKYAVAVKKLKEKDKEMDLLHARLGNVERHSKDGVKNQRILKSEEERLRQTNTELVAQIKLAHDAEERALNQKLDAQEECARLQKQVSEMHQLQLSRRTEMAVARHNLLQDVKGGRVDAWM